MTFIVVKNINGRACVSWPGAMILFVALLAACATVPAAIFWLAFDDERLTGTAVAIGFSIACYCCPLLLSQQLRLPIDRLPVRH
jgi:hypothetical protein